MATVTKGRTFTSGEIITPAKLNDVVDLATVTEIVNADIKSDAAVALSKLATGALPTAITVATANILDANVTTAKILDANVTDAKLATGIDASKLTTGTLPIARIADAAVTPSKLSQPLTLETSKASTSGTSVEFTGIPSWAKRITVMLSGVSTSGTSRPILQIGDSGGFETSGYSSVGAGFNSAIVDTITGGFALTYSVWAAAGVLSGNVTLANISGNTWTLSSVLGNATAAIHFGAGTKSLSDTLTQIRLTTVNGTDTFDAGEVNIMYEG
jgi:hypothetical protein